MKSRYPVHNLHLRINYSQPNCLRIHNTHVVGRIILVCCGCIYDDHDHHTRHRRRRPHHHHHRHNMMMCTHSHSTLVCCASLSSSNHRLTCDEWKLSYDLKRIHIICTLYFQNETENDEMEKRQTRWSCSRSILCGMVLGVAKMRNSQKATRNIFV